MNSPGTPALIKKRFLHLVPPCPRGQSLSSKSELPSGAPWAGTVSLSRSVPGEQQGPPWEWEQLRASCTWEAPGKPGGFSCLARDGSAALGLKPSLALAGTTGFQIKWSGMAVTPPKTLHYQDTRTQHYHRPQDPAFFLTISKGAFLSASRSWQCCEQTDPGRRVKNPVTKALGSEGEGMLFPTTLCELPLCWCQF